MSESCSESRFGSWFWPFPDLKAWFYPLWTQSSFKSSSQSSFRMWFVRVHHASELMKAKSTRNPLAIVHSLQLVVAILVNARSSYHEPNQEADHDLKRLSERDLLLCEQAQYCRATRRRALACMHAVRQFLVTLFCRKDLIALNML